MIFNIYTITLYRFTLCRNCFAMPRTFLALSLHNSLLCRNCFFISRNDFVTRRNDSCTPRNSFVLCRNDFVASRYCVAMSLSFGVMPRCYVVATRNSFYSRCFADGDLQWMSVWWLNLKMVLQTCITYCFLKHNASLNLSKTQWGF